MPTIPRTVSLPAPLLKGVCHDFKNYLTAMQGHAELALRGNGDETSRRRGLEAIMRATTEARKITSLMAALGDTGETQTEPWDIVALVQESLDALEDKSAFSCKLPDHPVVASVDRTTLLTALGTWLRALSSLLPAGSPPSAIILDQEEDTAFLHIQHDEIKETSDESHLLLTPLSAMASLGASLALGLFVARECLTAQGCVLSSAEGSHGIRVTLPLSDLPAQTSPEAQHRKTVAGATDRKHRVLLVDDEECMRHLGVDILQALNCRVSTASDASEALDLIKQNPGYFDLVLSDSRMPGMSGEDLALAISHIRADLPFVLVTAFSIHESAEILAARGIHAVINKPFLIEDLKRVLPNS